MYSSRSRKIKLIDKCPGHSGQRPVCCLKHQPKRISARRHLPTGLAGDGFILNWHDRESIHEQHICGAGRGITAMERAGS